MASATYHSMRTIPGPAGLAKHGQSHQNGNNRTEVNQSNLVSFILLNYDPETSKPNKFL